MLIDSNCCSEQERICGNRLGGYSFVCASNSSVAENANLLCQIRQKKQVVNFDGQRRGLDQRLSAFYFAVVDLRFICFTVHLFREMYIKDPRCPIIIATEVL